MENKLAQRFVDKWGKPLQAKTPPGEFHITNPEESTNQE